MNELEKKSQVSESLVELFLVLGCDRSELSNARTPLPLVETAFVKGTESQLKPRILDSYPPCSPDVDLPYTAGIDAVRMVPLTSKDLLPARLHTLQKRIETTYAVRARASFLPAFHANAVNWRAQVPNCDDLLGGLLL